VRRHQGLACRCEELAEDIARRGLLQKPESVRPVLDAVARETTQVRDPQPERP